MRRFLSTVLCVAVATPGRCDDAQKLPDQSAAEKRLEALGDLKDDVGVWFSMDTTERGGLAWARFNFKVVATTEVQIGADAKHRWMDFRAKGALLKFEPALDLGKRYTLCTWMRFPAPQKQASVWEAATGGGGALFVTDTALCAWSAELNTNIKYGDIPEDLKGWHHIAIVANETATRAFLDGKEIGKVDGVPSSSILSIGSHWSQESQDVKMCDALDDQFIFRRALSAKEIAKVMHFERPEE